MPLCGTDLLCPFQRARKANEIILEDDDGHIRPVSKEQLESIFSVFKDTLRLVVLNACYSEAQLAGFSKVIDYAVGTSSALGDQAAIEFAACFYQSLAFAHSIQEAFELAKCQVSIAGHSDSEIFALHIREGVDASEPFVKSRGKRLRAARPVVHPTTSAPEETTEHVTPHRPETKSTQSGSRTSSQRPVSSASESDLQPSIPYFRMVGDFPNEEIPLEIRNSSQKFRLDHPDPTKVAFLMMRFGKTKAHTNIVTGIRNALDPLGISIVRADDKQYHDDLFPNVLTYIYIYMAVVLASLFLNE